MKTVALFLVALLLVLPSRAAADVNAALVARRVAQAKEAMLTDVVAARRAAVDAEALAIKLRNDRAARLARASAQWLQAEASYRLGEQATAAKPLAAALAVVRRDAPTSQLMGDILLTRGSIQNTNIQPAGALKDYQSAYRIFHRIGNDRSQAITLMLIAGLYNDAKNHEGSLRYLKQALDFYHGDPGLMVALHNGRGIALQDLGRYEEAASQFESALKYAEQLRSPLMRVFVLANIAQSRLKAGRVAAADVILRQSLALTGVGEATTFRPKILAIAAQAAFQRGNLVQAAMLIDRSFADVNLSSTPIDWREPHETAYRIFQRLGRPEKALVHLMALKRIDDDVTKLATTTSTALMGARFDFANQELRIAKLRAQELQRRVELERTRAQTQRTIFYGGAAGAAIIVGVLTFTLVTVRRSRDEVRAANDDLAESNAALSQALAAKTEFLATTSHEIRTPLNGILGMTEVMLADATLAPAMRDRLGVVHGAGVTMRALVDDILDVAKMETGNLSLEHAPFDLRMTLRDASCLWEEQARSKGVAFVVALDDCPARVLGDAARVRQVVFNLLSNALKFTEQGQVTLSAAGDGGQVAITVADTGIGIPAGKQSQIFESFRQADASTTRRYGGTGLGLAICRKLTSAMGGDIGVTSTEGEGSTFTITLPLEEAPAASAPTLAEVGAGLLVIERNPITRAMWKSLLERHAGGIAFASSAQEAVAMLGQGEFARVLIDDVTIAAEGDAAAAAASVAAATEGETILLWSDTGTVETIGAATGVTHVVAKPVAGAALVHRLFVASSNVSDADQLVPKAA